MLELKKLTISDCKPSLRYSICTLVTRIEEYRECVNSFKAKGFSGDDCEFLYIDNSESNNFDAFSGYNLFLQEAKGKYIILCHQDILLIEDDRDVLDQRLSELDRLDPCWGLCGNAGGKTDGTLAIRISDPHRENNRMGGPFPARTVSLDENFIVVCRAANLALSRSLSGFHWYGAELCIVADILGYNAYVIDFHLRHKSAGNVDTGFLALRKNVTMHYRRAFRSRWIYVTTLRPVYLSASAVRYFFARAFRAIRQRIL